MSFAKEGIISGTILRIMTIIEMIHNVLMTPVLYRVCMGKK